MKTWADARKELFTPEEIVERDARVAAISKLIDARNEKIITQEQFEKMIEKYTPTGD